jgi:hypothetical protein
MPKLTENFDQLKMSSEIRSSDCFPQYLFKLFQSRVVMIDEYFRIQLEL